MKIDLHMHSNLSDGVLSPKELFDLFNSLEYDVISLTDHDNIEGCNELRKYAENSRLKILNGVEISSLINGTDVHILAYGFDPEYEKLKEMLAYIHQSRIDRAQKIISKLDELFLIKIPMELLYELSGKHNVIGRPHIARAIIRLGYAKSFNQVFESYIGDNSPAYFTKESCSPKEAIDIIHKAGGIAVLAHPGKLENEELVNELIKSGIDGIEVFYGRHDFYQVEHYESLCRKHNLFMSGGSDFHGNDPDYVFMKKLKVPHEKLMPLLKRTGVYNE